MKRGAGSPRIGPADESLVRLDERRKIARELHDSTSQLLVVLQLELHRLQESNLPRAQPIIKELRRTIGEIREQIRELGLDAPAD